MGGGAINVDEYSYGKSILKLSVETEIVVSSHGPLYGNDFGYLIMKNEDTKEACCRHYRIKSMFDYFLKYKYRAFKNAPIYMVNYDLWKIYKMYNDVDESDKQRFDKIFEFLKTIDD